MATPSATALILVIAMTSCGRHGPFVDVHTALVSELAGQRLALPRLSGPWPHAACDDPGPSPQGLTLRCDRGVPTPSPALAALRGRIRRSMRGDGDRGAALRALALWQLLWHREAEELDDAIEALREATRLAPADPRPLNDLAAVLLVRGELKDDPWDWLRALEHLERAGDLDHTAPEVAFNRAIALQALMATRLAQDAWTVAARSDPDEGWRIEANTRRVELETSLDDAMSLPADADWSAETWRALARMDPQVARERVLEHLMVEWGEALAVGDEAGAQARLAAARVVGEQIAAHGGDESILQMIRVIDEASTIDRAALGAGHVAYGRGRALERADLGGAIRELRQATRVLRMAGSVAGLWAQARLAFLVMTDPESPDPDRAYELHEEIVGAAVADRYPALAAKGEWGLSLNVGRGGRILEALPHQARATSLFAAAGEFGNLARSQSLEAELHSLVGDSRRSLRLALRALPTLLRRGDVGSAHTRFMDAGDLAWSEAGLARAALAMHDEAVILARESADPRHAAQMLLWRSQLQVRIGDPHAAVADLKAAAESVRGDWDPLLEGFAMLARARVALLDAPARAAEISTDAAHYFADADLPINLGEALGIRAIAYRRIGRFAEARDDLLGALRALARRGTPAALDPGRITFARTVRGLADELTSLLTEELQEPLAALGATEVARRLLFDDDSSARELLVALESGISETLQRLAVTSMPKGGRAFWVLPNRLLIWNLASQSVSLSMMETDGKALIDAGREYTRRLAAGQAFGNARDTLVTMAVELTRGDAKDEALVLVPDPLLLGIPWAALPLDDDRYLLEERLVAVFPSLGAAARAGARIESRSDWSVLAVGVPSAEGTDLPPLLHAAEEARAVAGIYGIESASENRFTSAAAFTAQIDRHEVLHFAGHAVFSAPSPEASHLILAPAAGAPIMVYPADLQGPPFGRLQIVVLSACSSIGSAGDVAAGLAGLARPFLLRGARAVVGTLWPLRDDVAMEAFTLFHRELRAGASAPAALRSTQLQLMVSDVAHFRDPAAWAGLAVIGGTGPPEGK